MTTYQLTGEGYVVRDDGAKIPIVDHPDFPNTNPDYIAYVQWILEGNVSIPKSTPTAGEQRILDQNRYQRRAAVQALLLSYMAADNMSRVRSGVWTVSQLVSLISDPAVQSAQTYMSTLSYELAAQSISAATNPILTPEIKADWVAKLTEHFYLEP